MLKWVVGLCVAMYGTLMIFGGEGYRPPEPETPVLAAQVVEPPLDTAAPEAANVVEAPQVTPTQLKPKVNAIQVDVADATPRDSIQAPPKPATTIEVAAVSAAPEATEPNALMPDPVNVTALAPQDGVPVNPAPVVPQGPSPSDIEAALLAASPPQPVAVRPIVQPEVATPNRTVARAPEIWRVTGGRVNLREGPSTQTRVIGRTVRGDSAEIIEFRDDGWAKVYVIDVGIEAYMSATFLSPDS